MKYHCAAMRSLISLGLTTPDSFQQVNLLDPLHTALRFIPTTISGFIVNLVTGYVMSRVPGQYLILAGLLGSIVGPLGHSVL